MLARHPSFLFHNFRSSILIFVTILVQQRAVFPQKSEPKICDSNILTIFPNLWVKLDNLDTIMFWGQRCPWLREESIRKMLAIVLEISKLILSLSLLLRIMNFSLMNSVKGTNPEKCWLMIQVWDLFKIYPKGCSILSSFTLLHFLISKGICLTMKGLRFFRAMSLALI